MAQDVFISYSHVDAETASAVAERLEREGISCWYAPRNIGPGEEWASAIIKALNSCRVMILIFSDNSNASVQVLREVNNAVSAHKTIIPFKITENDPTDAMQYYLATLHWLDANGRPMNRCLDELCDRVQAVMDGKEEDYVPQDLPSKGGKRGRRKKKGFFSFLYGIFFIIVNALFGIVMLYTYSGLCAFKDPTAVALLAAGLMSVVFFVFQVMRRIGRPITKYHWLICLGICLLISAISWIVGSSYSKAAPAFVLKDNGQEVSLNSCNYSFSVRGEDGTVYFTHNESGNVPSIRKCSYEDFLAGSKGEELVSNVWADNLVLIDESTLVFRDYSDNKPLMKMLDLDSGSIKILKKTDCANYYASGRTVYYGEYTTSNNGLAVITLDGKYDGEVSQKNCTARGWICYYEKEVYFINENDFLEDLRTGTLGSKKMQQFIIYDDIIYYHGIDGGLYRAPLNDASDMEKMCDADPSAMTACGDYIYFLNQNDNSYLYRIPTEGGEPELVLDRDFNTLNIIGDCLYLCDYAETYIRLNVNDID